MPKKLKIWLDDERDPGTKKWQKYIAKNFGEENLSGWVWVKTAEECIELLGKENVEAISLDHDLGDPDNNGKGKTGYDVIKWIEEEVFTNRDYIPPEEMQAHSQNPSGRDEIEMSIKHIEAMIAKRRESKG